MKNDLDKVLSKTLATYFSILFAVFALKMFGVEYFDININNSVLNKINDVLLTCKLEQIWFTFTLFLNTYIVLAISCNDKSKDMIKFTILTMPLNFTIRVLKQTFDMPFLFVFTDLLYLFILSLCYIKFVKRDKIQKDNVINYWLFMGINFIFQLVSLITRNIVIGQQEDVLVKSLVMNIDLFALMFMTYKLYFMKGGTNLWIGVHGYFSDLLIFLRELPRKLQTSYQKCKPKKGDDELANKIFLILFWLYNMFTILVILLIATLNETFIECIFILSSFWINKGVFGKAFHLKKASTCFIVSSLSYYILNRLTWDIRMTFLIPILLGILLSYITSKFMARKENIYLYKGMPEDKFYDLIRKVTDNEEHIAICKMYYVDKETNVKVAIKFNFSEIRIKQIKADIVEKIKELNH